LVREEKRGVKKKNKRESGAWCKLVTSKARRGVEGAGEETKRARSAWDVDVIVGKARPVSRNLGMGHTIVRV
jgi:hypothetical protein